MVNPYNKPPVTDQTSVTLFKGSDNFWPRQLGETVANFHGESHPNCRCLLPERLRKLDLHRVQRRRKPTNRNEGTDSPAQTG